MHDRTRFTVLLFVGFPKKKYRLLSPRFETLVRILIPFHAVFVMYPTCTDFDSRRSHVKIGVLRCSIELGFSDNRVLSSVVVIVIPKC